MCAEDEMADILVAGSKRTFAGVLACGLGKMIDMNGSGGEDMADTWTVFGDPSRSLTFYHPLRIGTIGLHK